MNYEYHYQHREVRTERTVTQPPPPPPPPPPIISREHVIRVEVERPLPPRERIVRIEVQRPPPPPKEKIVYIQVEKAPPPPKKRVVFVERQSPPPRDLVTYVRFQQPPLPPKPFYEEIFGEDMMKSVMPQESSTTETKVIRLTTDQEAVLQAQFNRWPKNPHHGDVVLLAAETGLSEEDVQDWYTYKLAQLRKEQGLGGGFGISPNY